MPDQVPYKFFGSPQARTDAANTPWYNSEHNYSSSTSMIRINDLNMVLPAFGEGASNEVMWTPSFRRENIISDTGFSKVTQLDNLSIEELLIPFANTQGASVAVPGTNISVNRYSYTVLQAQGVTMYIKIKNEPDVSGNEATPEVRDTISGAGITIQAITRLSGICAFNGSEITTGIGNTFSLKYDDAFCIGLRMDKACGTTANSRGTYYYYLVNRNSANNGEIIWRMQFTVGLGGNGFPSSISANGKTLPAGIAIVGNPEPLATKTGITLNGLSYSALPGFTDSGGFFTHSVATTGQAGLTLQILYYTPSGFTTGTDNLAIQYPEYDPDYRPYLINNVPVP